MTLGIEEKKKVRDRLKPPVPKEIVSARLAAGKTAQGVEPPLVAKWSPGQTGRSGGTYLGECLHAYSSMPRMKLAKILRDDTQTAAVLAAVNLWYRAASCANWRSAHAAIAELADRLIGDRKSVV